MDKDKVLPLVQLPPDGNISLSLAVKAILETQRDADWDRVKPLVAALQKVAEDDDPPDAYSEMAKRVLAPCG